MKRSVRQSSLALSFVVLVAAVVAACGQVTTGEESQPVRGIRAAGPASASLTAEQTCVPGEPACTPTGAHAKHTTDCTECHAVAGRLAFKLNGLAYGPGWTSAKPRPTFDAVAKTCSNVACHAMPSGSFSYFFPGGDGEPVYNTVTIAGSAGRTTPSWYATGSSTCTGCHDNPPRNGSSGSNVWHSGYHNGGPNDPPNQCQYCHPDATGANGVGTAITNPSLHGNGVFNVQARFTSACFGCH